MKWVWLSLMLAVGCKSGSNFERDGDVAFRAGRWVDAMASYHNAVDDPDALAKYADAAFRGGFLPEAVAAWRELEAHSPARAQEAGTGLIRAAMAAERERNQVVLAAAIAAIRQVVPGWPVTRLARNLDDVRGLVPADAAQVWLVMFSAAPDPAAALNALTGFANAEAAQDKCVEAIPVFESAARRSTGTQRDSLVRRSAPCELKLALQAMEQVHDREAEDWFERASAHDPNGVAGRRALVGFGDVRLRQGDLAAALVAWRTVVASPETADSVFTMALERLQNAQAVTSDTGRVQAWW